MKMKRNQFTLIELLVVIAIIGILAGILLPAISSSVNEAKKTSTKSDCVQIAMAVASYNVDYGGLALLPNEDSQNFNSLARTVLNGTHADWRTNNPRRKKYYDTGVDMVNPWGKEYTIQVDVDGDRRIMTDIGELVTGTAAVFTETADGLAVVSWK